MKLPLFEASATLIGTVIGAGILAIPYAVSQGGLTIGLVLLLVLGFLIGLRHLMLAEIALRTPHSHQMPGYAGIHLGGIFKYFDFGIVVVGGLGSMLAYMIGEGEVLAAIFGGSPFNWALAFFIVASLFVYFGLNIVKHSELVMTLAIFVITLLIGVFSWRQLNIANLFFSSSGDWVLPYGVILFAYTGAVAIPEMRRQLRGRESDFPKAIVLASVVIFLVYFIFTVLVLGVTGDRTTEVATIGLGQVVGSRLLLIGNLLAFFTMGTSFLTVSLGLRDMFRFDYHLPPPLAWFIVVILPLIIFVLGARDFIKIISLIGGVLAGLQTVIIVLTFWRARLTGWRRPEFTLGPMRIAGTLIILIFLIGVVATLLNT